MRSKKESEPPNEPQPELSAAARANLREQILAAYRSRNVSYASDFIEQLSQETNESTVQRITLQAAFNALDSFLEKSMTTWVDRIFDHFQDFIAEFNPIVKGTEIEVNCERPVVTQEVVSYNVWKEPDLKVLLFKGWLTTRRWVLLVRGTREKVDIYICPGDRVIGITRKQTTFRPVVTLIPSFDTGKVAWTRDREVVSLEKLNEISKEVFSLLIHYARGDADESALLVGGPPIGNEVNSTSKAQAVIGVEASAELGSLLRRNQFEKEFFSSQGQDVDLDVRRREELQRANKLLATETNPPDATEALELTGANVELAEQLVSIVMGTKSLEVEKTETRSATTELTGKEDVATTTGRESETDGVEVQSKSGRHKLSKISKVFTAAAQDVTAEPKTSNQERTNPVASESNFAPDSQPLVILPKSATSPLVDFSSPSQLLESTDNTKIATATATATASDVSTIFDMLLKSIDRELEQLANTSADTALGPSVDKAQWIRRQSEKLKTFREKVVILLKDWAQTQSAD